MTELPTPEEVIGTPEAPPLVLSLRCTRCGETSREKFEWACLHPDLEGCRAAGWDGVTLSRIVVCVRCGAVDSYALSGDSSLMLTAAVLGRATGGRRGRVAIVESRLWDGTQVRRPSQALARLRELVAENPTSAQALRRLGNGCKRFGLRSEAETAWRRAVALDANELESLALLADLLLESESTAEEGYRFLERAVRAIPGTRTAETDARRNGVKAVFAVLRHFADDEEAPLALMAAWQSERVGDQVVVNHSSVELSKVIGAWEALVDFAASPKVLALTLTDEVSEEPTLLEGLLLGGDAPMLSAGKQRPITAAPRVGRNEPCPCGSGKKFKRCCAESRDAQT